MKLLKLTSWVFVAGMSLFAAIGMFLNAASVDRSGGGPEAALEGVAVAIVFLLSLIAAGLFACCIIFRPRELTGSPPRLVIAVVLALGIAVSPHVAHHPHRIDLVLAFSDDSRASVVIEPSGRTYGHLVRPDSGVTVRSVTPFEMRFESILVPNTADVTLEIKRL